MKTIYKRSYELEQKLVKEEACDWDRFKAFLKLVQELEKEIDDLNDENEELNRTIGYMDSQ